MAQLVERTLGKGEVPSSILGISTIFSILLTCQIIADMAQLVERTLGKGEVPSSILGISTIFYSFF